ncbi:GNAT family N-acetyltransferase [Mucilaginibacter myungsuensis]|uniref:GNAT family N-acetyltransferase n=1 Tax=Mucilaginibacter myungsuensis TaxID=649104 RepID=A0A929KZU6_9SPHI|nr:GNAT family N-acetyltransferase [Mucilaginibacter myungsuensis]MBE9663662.1 GNAT family N-acetyltransferase [Mucilaginibacter myungsuensis]MDN3599014.1 GNAT family N-acetyltransferase [Mucilaginibacter myungsuensis]
MRANITLSKVGQADLEPLLIFSKKTFFDAFYHLNNPEDVEAYATKAFAEGRLAEELNDPASEFYFACINCEIVGYIKLNYGPAQTDVNDDTSVELERIYVSSFHQGKQIGQQLMEFAIQTAKDKKLKYVWLGVWEHNQKAIKFYQRHGFKIFGEHDFMLGKDKQVDKLMKLVI